MERNLFKYIWRNSWRDQLIILAVVVVAQVFYFVSLDLPKRIVNNAIQGEAFTEGLTTKFLSISVGPFDWLGIPEIPVFDGLELERLPYLIALCFAFLFFVVINGWLKQQVNTEKGRLGERMLRRLRYELFDRVLRFPLGYFRKVKQAEIATMIKDEVEPLGGFIGDAFIQPAFLGGQALTALFFIMVQSAWLGGVTIAVLGVQLVIIPRMRVRLLILGKQRQVTARQLAGRIAEVADGNVEIHTNDVSNFERADIVNRLERIFLIRFDLYKRKFLVKYINNMLAQVTPFLFYLIGGWLALTGRFDVGSLVAAIGAYKDLPGPIKELIDWDQQRQQMQISYDQVIEQFTPRQMLAPELQSIQDQATPIEGGYSLSAVSVIDESGSRIIEDATIDFLAGEHWAVLGSDGSGAEAIGPVLARLAQPHSGTVLLGGHDLSTLHEAVVGRQTAYVGDETFLLPLSISDNVSYVFRHRPMAPARYEGAELQLAKRRLSEAIRSGNPPLDINAQWIDYSQAGVTNSQELLERTIGLLSEFEMEDDIYQFGLRGRIDPEEEPELAARFLEARAAMIERLREPAFAGLVEVFDPSKYNSNMTVAENLLFGTSKGSTFAPETLGDSPILVRVIEAQELTRPLSEMGFKIAETMVELFADLPPGHPFFEQFSFIAADDLQGFQQLISRVQKSGLDTASQDDRQRLIALTFPYIEARHRLGLIDPNMEERLLGARRAFAEALPIELHDAIEFYDPSRYNSSAIVQDNILFGRLVYGQAQAQQKVLKLVFDVIDQLDLKSAVLTVGLDYNVGSGGKRLSAAQRQKVAMLRSVLRQPQFLILGNALAPLETSAQPRIAENLRRLMKGRGLVMVSSNGALALGFEHVAVMRNGRIVEKGKLSAINQPGSKVRELVEARA